MFLKIELKECFNIFDSDKSGTISAKELKKVLEALNIKVKDEEVNLLLQSMDKDGSGQIDFEEFAEVMAEQFYRKPSRKELENAFKYFDKGNIFPFFHTLSIILIELSLR